jgi:tetratricopeptide (TPR) repeat protein
MLRIDNENSFRAALSSGINFFLGAGFSVLARNAADQTLPVGPDLKERLLARFNLKSLDNLDLAQLCTVIESSKESELRAFFEQTFRVKSYDPRYHILDRISIEHVFTTNIDNLIYEIFKKGKLHYLNDVTQKGPTRKDKSSINYVPLHGTIENRNSRLLFATNSIAAAFAGDPDLWHMLSHQMQRLPTLFWGYSLADAGVLQTLDSQTAKGRELKDRWIVLRKPEPGAEEYFRALRFNIIIADSAQLLDYLSNATPVIAPPQPTEPTEKLFPEETVPSLGTGPVRPLIEFYLGDAPTWHDIFSGRLHKTQHASAILNAINGRKNTVVIGIPACGKTTLLMQCAVEATFPGHKLVLNSLTEEKARFMLERLNGSSALFFVDDMAESVDAVALLMSSPNVTVIAFEREHNFELVSHKLDHKLYELLSVTELSPQDFQQIFNRIPPEIRVPKQQQAQTQPGVQPSLFEVVETNITSPTLRKRFAQVLKELSAEPKLHDLLVMLAYVHTCRTPVSFDMAYAFLRDRITDYSEVFALVQRLGQLLSSYVGALIDGDQDYYVPRSAIVSEAIIDQVAGPAFRRVLERFHREVSPLRICRFDMFKRGAFDADFFGRAFPNWREGLAFYDELYKRDPSPYLRQQGALYLSHKKRYHEAFSWIDEALLLSARRIPSIRHTHAIILFNANIELAGGSGKEQVRALLDQSMEILTDCYRYDKRKTYHALTFADQALKYWRVYGDEKATGYLQKAYDWLKDEYRKSSWHRRLKELVNRTYDALRGSGK